MNGFDLILERIKADPYKATLRFRYLALIADLHDPMEKASEVLKLAEFCHPDFPREALQSAYLVCRYDPKNLKAVQIIIDILEGQKRLPQASFMREYRAKIASQQSVTSNQFFNDISKSGLFEPNGVDEALSFNPGEEFLADQISGDFSMANESKLMSLLSKDHKPNGTDSKPSSSLFELTPDSLSGSKQSQSPAIGSNLSQGIASSEGKPMTSKSHGQSPSSILSEAPSVFTPPASLTPPSTLTPPTSLTLPSTLLSKNAGSQDLEARERLNSESQLAPFDAMIDLAIEVQESSALEAIADLGGLDAHAVALEFSDTTSLGAEDQRDTSSLSLGHQPDVSLTEISWAHEGEVQDKAVEFGGDPSTQLYSPLLDLDKDGEVEFEKKTFLSQKFPASKWSKESPTIREDTMISSRHRGYGGVNPQEGSEGFAEGTLISSFESTENHDFAEAKDHRGANSKILRDEPFGKVLSQSLVKDVEGLSSESPNSNLNSGPQSAVWWQQALASHSKKTALGTLELDPQSFSYFLQESLPEQKSSHEVIRRYLTTEQKQRLFSYFLNVSTPGMELLKIDVFMAFGASLEAVQLVRDYVDQGEIDLSALVQRARFLWQALGWQPFIWRGQEGREEFRRILFLRPSQRPSLEML